MNDDMPPLKIDLRLILETIGDGLAVLVVGVAALNLDDPWRVGVPLLITVLLVMTRRLLGQKVAAVERGLGKERDGLAVERSVLSAEAKPAVIQVAADASAALRAPRPTSNAPSVEHQP